MGLCGNFDLKTINEMRTPENLELTNPQEFGSSWAAVEVRPSRVARTPSLSLMGHTNPGPKPGENHIGTRLFLGVPYTSEWYP